MPTRATAGSSKQAAAKPSLVAAGDLNDYTNYQIPTGRNPIEGRKPETFSSLEEGDAETAYLDTDGNTERPTRRR
ncbi:MAG: hypothetical protein U5J64_05970 [Halobacteriales archaeon]|nr:hypothetical protein [Halobacteriales archaeon]